MSEISPTAALTENGVSIWLDDLSRDRITSGQLQNLITERQVSGVTTNPTIFAGALANSQAYQAQLATLAASNASAEEAVFAITTADVRDACDVFLALYQQSSGVDGRVSIEVSPTLANDTVGTVAQAKELFEQVGRENVLIKIPATLAGLPAITEVIAAGISVNVTLIFSLERYSEVIDAYLAGLERAAAAGLELKNIHSVASFFVSRVDTEIDKRLAALDHGADLRGKAGLANARLAYQLFEKRFAEERARVLLARGANAQRPLWASTGVKDPALPDTLYVTELVAPNTVNTMPEKTLAATFDHAVITGNTITGEYSSADAVFTALADLGIDFAEVTELLEREGVEKFVVSWSELLATVTGALEAAR